jgi:hypothetical protein
MRVVKEFTQDQIRISVFIWNNKYLVKFEEGPLEQTFKISELDIIDETDLEAFCKGPFFEKVKSRFKEMGQSLQIQIQNL